MVTSAKTSFHWEKVLFEVKTVLCSYKTQRRGQMGLAHPGGPNNTTFSPFSRKRMVAGSSIWRLSIEGWKEKSKLSRVF